MKLITHHFCSTINGAAFARVGNIFKISPVSNLLQYKEYISSSISTNLWRKKSANFSANPPEEYLPCVPEVLVHAGMNGQAIVVEAKPVGVAPGAADLGRLFEHHEFELARISRQMTSGAEAGRARSDHAHLRSSHPRRFSGLSFHHPRDVFLATVEIYSGLMWFFCNRMIVRF